MYEIAMCETLHYLKGIKQEDIDKIPNKLLTFFRENCSKDYECDFDYTKPLKDLKISNEAKGLISMICLNYWAVTDKQKQDFEERLKENEEKYQDVLREKYNPDELFKNKHKFLNEESEDKLKEISMVKYKESIVSKILKIFKR